MRNTADLLERFKTQLQRNHTNVESCQQVREVLPGDHYKDGYGQKVTVVAVSQYTIIFRRDGYDQNCEMPRNKFLNEFVEVEVKS
jgi:hypothetical protein